MALNHGVRSSLMYVEHLYKCMGVQPYVDTTDTHAHHALAMNTQLMQ